MCEETGRIENFRRVAKGEKGGHQGIYFNDSDVYKLLEAMAYSLLVQPTPDVRDMVGEAVGLIEAAQEQDGYINTFIHLEHPDKRYLSLAAKHEMYCMGHLLEACCAYESALGDGRLKSVATRVADHLASTFGPDKRKGYGGHEEIEMGLARTGIEFDRPQDVALSKWMTDTRGTRPSPFEDEINDPVSREFSPWLPSLWCKAGKYDGAYGQDDLPLSEQTTAVGHAVRAMYQYCGAMDSRCHGDTALDSTLQTIWSNLVGRRMYVTGGIGSSPANEGFTDDFDLPNRTAYAETCAGIGLCMWAARMGVAFGKGEYFDVFERSLFNGVLSGMDLTATAYHYENPLESTGAHVRQPWFVCACCPPNVARFVLSLGRYVASWSRGTVSVNVPLGMEVEANMNGVPVKVVVESAYPHGGQVIVRVHPSQPVKGTLRVRVPSSVSTWSSPDGGELADGYLSWSREWNDGDQVRLDLVIRPEFVRCDPRVGHNIGHVSVKRGPLVYCLEEVDLGSKAQRFAIDEAAGLKDESDPDPRVGNRLRAEGLLDETDWNGPLYQSKERRLTPASVALVPYATWGNRSTGSMQVWLTTARA